VCGLEAYKENQAGYVYVELKIYMANEFFDSVKVKQFHYRPVQACNEITLLSHYQRIH